MALSASHGVKLSGNAKPQFVSLLRHCKMWSNRAVQKDEATCLISYPLLLELGTGAVLVVSIPNAFCFMLSGSRCNMISLFSRVDRRNVCIFLPLRITSRSESTCTSTARYLTSSVRMQEGLFALMYDTHSSSDAS